MGDECVIYRSRTMTYAVVCQLLWCRLGIPLPLVFNCWLFTGDVVVVLIVTFGLANTLPSVLPEYRC